MPTVLLSGSQTAVIGTTHYLVSENATNGTFVFSIDTRNMEDGDSVTFQILARGSVTGPSVDSYGATYYHKQGRPMKYSIPVPSPFRTTFTLAQLDSITGNIFDWTMMNAE